MVIQFHRLNGKATLKEETVAWGARGTGVAVFQTFQIRKQDCRSAGCE